MCIIGMTQETKQVQTLRNQNRFLGYGHKAEKCVYCNEIIHSTTVKFNLLDGKTVREQVLSDYVKGFSKKTPFLEHLSTKHNKQFIENLKAVLKRN